jgi:hypothetical protein
MTTPDNRALWELVENLPRWDLEWEWMAECADGDYIKRADVLAILERPVVVGDEDVERAASAYDKVINSRVLHWTSGNPFAKNDAMRAALESMVRGKS